MTDSTQPTDPPRDVDALMRRQRERIASQRQRSGSAGTVPSRSDAGAVDADAVTLSLEQAAALADIGAALPPLEHLSVLRRAAARLAGRVMLYFLRLVTVDQQQYNHLVLRAISGVRREADRLHAELAAVRGADDALRDRLRGVEAALAQCQRDVAEAGAARALIERRTGEIESAVAAGASTRAQLALQEADHDGRLAELRRGLHALQAETAAVRHHVQQLAGAAESPAAHRRDDFVVDRMLVSNAFRGSEAELAERQRRYVSCFEGRRNVLDVGCGRGEFVRLLKDAGIPARGVDIDRDMALWCQEKGLDVVCADALTYLAALEDASLDGIFCAQVVEHLATSDMLHLLHLAYDKLCPDGVLVIETLNPESLFVLYRWFWIDLTHERLVHPEALKVLLQSYGFRHTECRFVPLPDGPLPIPPLRLDHEPPEALEPFNAATQYLNGLLYSSFDYAVIATR